MKYFQDKSGGAAAAAPKSPAFNFPGLLQSEQPFGPQVDETEVIEPEKYILAGHGAVSETKKFTIVPNNVTTLPYGSIFLILAS